MWKEFELADYRYSPMVAFLLPATQESMTKIGPWLRPKYRHSYLRPMPMELDVRIGLHRT